MTDLKRRTTRALAWSFGGTLGTQGVQFIFSILLARLLTPAEFGLIAMLSLFMALAQSMIDSGFGSALIQKKDATRVDESSVFYLNLCVAGGAYMLLWFGAPFIAAFYREPILIPLSRVLGLNFIINSFGLVQMSVLRKRLDMRTLAQRTFVGTLASGPVGVVLALRGYGVWSLAAQGITANLVRTALLWVWSDWRPVARFSGRSLASLYSYGSKLFLSGIISTTFDNLYPMLIGRLFSKSDLGFYTRAISLERLPSQTITGVISQVAFPAFSSIQDDKRRLKVGYRRAMGFACFLVFPIMLGLTATAEPLFLVLFTKKWAASIPYFRVLCLAGMLYPLHALNLNALKAVGSSDLFLRLEVIKKVNTVVAILITYRYGIGAMVWGQAATSYIALFLNTYYTGRFIDYPLREQAQDVIPYFLLSAAMGGVVFALSVLIVVAPIYQLAVQIPVGIGLYVLAARLMELPAYMDVAQIASARLNFRKKAVAA